MIDLKHPKEDIELPNGEKVTIVDIPSNNLHQHEKKISEYLKGIGHESGDIYKRYGGGTDMSLVTWGEYLTQWVNIWQSFRKHGSVKFKPGTTDYGVPHWDSFTTCIGQVSDTIHQYLMEKLNDFKDKATPDIDNLTLKKATTIVDNILKKKNMEATLDFCRWTGLRNCITVMAKELLKLQNENLQSIGYIERLEKQKEASKITK